MSAVLLRLLLVACVALLAAPVQAQPEVKKYDRNFFETDAGLNVEAALHCFGASKPLGALGARVLASEYPLLQDWRFTFDEVLPLNWRNLAAIQDNRSLPDVRARELWELDRPDRAFYAAYIEALSRSRAATAEMFAKSGEEYRQLLYHDLVTEAKRYRGKVITVKGTMLRLRQRDAPARVQHEGIDKIYVGEIKGPTPRAPVFVAVFTDLPLDLEPAEKMRRSVTFQGYFLANIRFPADKGSAPRDLPHVYLVGKTVIVHDKPAPEKADDAESSHSYILIVCTVGGIVVVVIIGVLLNVWFRRSDQRIRSQLADVRDKHQPFNLEPDSTPTVDNNINGEADHGIRRE